MPYPSFPAGGVGARPLFFSTFDPSHMGQALNVFANPSDHAAGAASMYNTNQFDPPAGSVPSGWNPRFAMFGNSGMTARTSPILWAQRFGLSRAFLITYAGGEVPD